MLAPVLREHVEQTMAKHYTGLEKNLNIHAPGFTLKTLTYHSVKNDATFHHLKFENINQNKSKHGTNKAAYDYSVNHPVDLAKLYLPEDHARFSAFDESFGVSAPLLLLSHSKLLVELHSQSLFQCSLQQKMSGKLSGTSGHISIRMTGLTRCSQTVSQ